MLLLLTNFLLSGLITAIATLRIIKINEQETGYKSALTTRGKLTVAITAGSAVGLIIVLLDGMWWDCGSTTCSFRLGY